MAHPQQLCFIETFSKYVSSDWHGKKILEIGSYIVEGGIRGFFANSDYLGVDLTPGPGVDLVASGHLVEHPDNTYDVTVSCECFEHNPYWLETFFNMYRMTLPGGFVVFSCATRGRLEHGTCRTSPESSPGTQHIGWDYYLNLEEVDFTRRIQFKDLFDDYIFISNKESRTLFFVGKKTADIEKYKFNSNEFFREHQRLQRLLRKNLWESSSLFQRLYAAILVLVMLPIKLFIWLPDPYFQNIFVNYVKILRRVSKIFPRSSRCRAN